MQERAERSALSFFIPSQLVMPALIAVGSPQMNSDSPVHLIFILSGSSCPVLCFPEVTVRLLAAAALSFLLPAACARPDANPGGAATVEPLKSPGDLQALASRPPTRRAAYGTDSSQYGELRVPSEPGPHPVAVLIHGGCFKAAYANARELGAVGDTLGSQGIATWNVEYRRLGETGGGWPGTYLDVGRAVDHLRELASEHSLDLTRVVVVGHSAGGHLAMWAASRSRLPATSPLHQADPLPLRGVVNLAGPIDMTQNIPGYEAGCRDSVVTSLLGGTPATVPERYTDASAISRIPLGIPQVIVLGEHETFVPRAVADAYVEAATRAGDAVRLLLIPGVGHFEIAMPNTAAWGPVEAAIKSLLSGDLPKD